MLINFRDIGGMPVQSGKKIKTGLIYRCAELSKITDEDVEFLWKKLGIKKNYDLRSDLEINAKPDYEIANVAYIHFPLIKETNLAEMRPQFGDMIAKLKEQISLEEKLAIIPEMPRLYSHMLDSNFSLTNLRALLLDIITYDRGPILYHCASGKDRTGIVTALLYSILGVSRQDIVADYMKSYEWSLAEYAEIHDTVIRYGESEILAQALRGLIVVEEENIEAFLDTYEEKYGGREGMLHELLELTDEDMDAFRKRMLE